MFKRYLCRDCGKRYNERINTLMARLRTPTSVVSAALNLRLVHRSRSVPQAYVNAAMAKKALWWLASVYLNGEETHPAYQHRKV